MAIPAPMQGPVRPLAPGADFCRMARALLWLRPLGRKIRFPKEIHDFSLKAPRAVCFGLFGRMISSPKDILDFSLKAPRTVCFGLLERKVRFPKGVRFPLRGQGRCGPWLLVWGAAEWRGRSCGPDL